MPHAALICIEGCSSAWLACTPLTVPSSCCHIHRKGLAAVKRASHNAVLLAASPITATVGSDCVRMLLLLEQFSQHKEVCWWSTKHALQGSCAVKDVGGHRNRARFQCWGLQSRGAPTSMCVLSIQCIITSVTVCLEV